MKPMTLPILPFWFILLIHSTLDPLWFQPCSATSALGNQTDYLALLKFKESISDDPYKILTSWNGSIHFCNWHGITCSRRHQRVTELNLGGYLLRGFLSPHIGNLSFLRSITLQNNSFHGEIPQELGHLFRLKILSLVNNTLAGKIPTNITSCSELRYLHFSRNNLTGRIPTEIGFLKKLEGLHFQINGLSGQIPASVWNLSSLGILSLNFNNLEGNIPEEIGLMKNLTSLEIVANKLSGVLPYSLFNLSSLTVISATYNQFNGSLPANMFLTLPNLQVLEISENQILGPIPSSVTNASALQELEIAYNHFVGPVPSLGKLQDLSILQLAFNNLGSNSSKDLEFLSSLVNCSNLFILDMAANNFGGQLPNTIGNLSTQLSNLYLGSNKIFGKIPAALGNLINLNILEMDNNYFTKVIPATFGKFQKMKKLYLMENKLSGEIPSFIGNLSQLLLLGLSHNMLEGHIPPSIGNCRSLQALDLSQNNLTGDIPVEVIGLSSLSIFLNLSHNSFSGNLHAEVGKLKNIGDLDVSQNHLSGQIPRAIGDCMSLEYLYLQGNSFQETIPSSLASLKGLRYLDLSRNNLSGSIPKGLQDIFGLEYLNVSFNLLDGEVPRKGVFGNASAISVAGNSKLCGGISELKLPLCPSKVMKKRKHHSFKLVTVISCAVAFLLLLSSIVAIYHMRKRNRKSSSNSPTIDLLSKVSYQSLHNATDGFSANNLIGSGSFGSVYKGSIDSQEVVAIKVLNLHIKGAHKSFVAECNALRNIRQRNLVKVFTCCSSTDYKGQEFKALVFEYMANGSLENWLHPITENANHPRTFLLDQILNIVMDVASALHYLHYECEQPVVHCDLKPSNVLLDGDMVAHVSDFGLARLLPTINGISNKQSSTSGIKGTIGYAPPEYGMGFAVSIEGDMYSFGILVLEMLTGRRPTEDTFNDGQNLHNYVESAFPNNLLQIVNPAILPSETKQIVEASRKQWENMTLIHPNAEKCLFSLFRIGLSCSVETPKERMSIVEVTRELNLIRNSFLCGGFNRV